MPEYSSNNAGPGNPVPLQGCPMKISKD